MQSYKKVLFSHSILIFSICSLTYHIWSGSRNLTALHFQVLSKAADEIRAPEEIAGE